MDVTRAKLSVLFFAMLISGLVSVYFGKELCWDLANYHFYNPYSLLYHRYDIDYWPNSNIHQYINPAIDLLSYFLIQGLIPIMSEFVLGAIHGVNFWLLFLIADHFVEERHKSIYAILLAGLGIFGPTALPGMGSFQNDNLVSIFILGFILLQIKTFANQRYLFLSGLLPGMGFGLKLTAGIYIAGAMFAWLSMPASFSMKTRYILLSGIGILTGMLITSGYWMLMMWKAHHNPFFPFLNSIFHSPDFPLTDWRDMRFLPKTFLEAVFFPFYFSFDGRTGDQPFRDFRFAILYILFIIAGFNYLRKIRLPNLSVSWLFLFFIFSYLTWQAYFSIARYLVPLEMLAPIIIYLLLKNIVKNRIACYVLLLGLFSIIMFCMVPIKMIRAPWYDKTFFNVRLPASVNKTQNAIVLMAYSAYVMNTDPRPQSYLIPFFPKTWQFIGIPLLNEKSALQDNAIKSIRSKIAANHAPIYLLTSDRNMPELFKAAYILGFKPYGNCEKIFSDRQAITHQAVLLCPVTKS